LVNPLPKTPEELAIILIKVWLSSVPKTTWRARLQSPPDHINKQAMINLEVIFVYVVRSFITVIGYYIIVRSFPAENTRTFLEQNLAISYQYNYCSLYIPASINITET